MPSLTFLNLDKEKQNKLIDAAMSEFTSHLYSEVSINQIIINAGISRGSFYMYFSDKDDLFEYLFEVNRQKLFSITKEVFIKNSGDLYCSFSELYDLFIEYAFGTGDFKIMFKNVFIYFNLHKRQFEKPGCELFSQVKDLINRKNIKEEDLEFIFVMLLHTLFMSITYAIDNDMLTDKELYLRKLNILCYGIYK